MLGWVYGGGCRVFDCLPTYLLSLTPITPLPPNATTPTHNSQATNAAFDTFNRESSQMISDMLSRHTLQALQFAAYAAHEVGGRVPSRVGTEGGMD